MYSPLPEVRMDSGHDLISIPKLEQVNLALEDSTQFPHV
jgi:hypothetical protein